MQEEDDDREYNDRLERAEHDWCIRQGVAREWGPTFDRFLELYNTQDMTTIFHTLRNNEEQCRTDDKLSIKQLKNWMKPKFQPPTWMKIFCHKKYMDIKKTNNLELQSLLANSPDDTITKVEFIDRIMQELRDGNSKVQNELKKSRPFKSIKLNKHGTNSLCAIANNDRIC